MSGRQEEEGGGSGSHRTSIMEGLRNGLKSTLPWRSQRGSGVADPKGNPTKDGDEMARKVAKRSEGHRTSLVTDDPDESTSAAAAATTSSSAAATADRSDDVHAHARVLKSLQSLRLKEKEEQAARPVPESTVFDPPWAADALEGNTVKTRTQLGEEAHYNVERVVGKGSFGVVYQAKDTLAGCQVAIKKVLQDKRFKNRELQIMRSVRHPNIVRLHNFFYTTTQENHVYLNLVLEFVPDTIYRVVKQYAKAQRRMPLVLVKLYMYQMLRSLAYIHGQGICHRDIKPQNLLVNPETHVVKLCDFGSAKKLVRGEPNISYICSRYYRAPELIFGATTYTTAVDVWSAGCVMGELLSGQPLFPGESGVDQLIEIIKALGTPTKDEIKSMNPNYTDFKFPQIKGASLGKIFGKESAETVDLVAHMLRYLPDRRDASIEACAHPFFDELRAPDFSMSVANSSQPVPPLFNFRAQELAGTSQAVIDRLIPEHVCDQM